MTAIQDSTVNNVFSGSISKTTYSGVDIRVFVAIDPATMFSKVTSFQQESLEDSIVEISSFGESYRELGELSTISYSVYREKEMVKALGNPMARGFTRGYLTVAGTMIFTVMYEAVMHELFNRGYFDTASFNLNTIRIDQLPPLDIFIIFQNEAGQISKMGIFGVEFMNEGQVMSISDLITENSVNYVARHIYPMKKVDKAGIDKDDLKIMSTIYLPTLLQSQYEEAAEDFTTLRDFFI